MSNGQGCCTSPSCAARTPMRGWVRSICRGSESGPAWLPLTPPMILATTGNRGRSWWPPPIEGMVFNERTQVPLARGKVRHVGEPVAAVVAESRYIAEDALVDISVEYQPL